MTLLAFVSLLTASLQDDPRARIAERVEKELRDSQVRLQEDLRVIIESELKKKKPSPPLPETPKPAARRPVLGITVGDFSDAERKTLGIGGGVKVAEVRGPAQKAGVQAGDILLSIGATSVNEDTLGATLDSCKAGETVELTVLREKKRLPLKVTLTERAD